MIFGEPCAQSAVRRCSLFGDHHIHGPEGIRFYTRGKAITVRWPEGAQGAAHHKGHMHFPTAV
jgi:malonate-semialdehyde dehydrogenase (acetylating) / methylmalonate-semialdehyde dehydrogenase